MSDLTPDQQKIVEATIAEWIEIGRTCERADRPRAERGIRLAFRTAKMPEPIIDWYESPLAAFRRCRELLPDVSPWNSLYGQHAAGWLCFYDAAGRLGTDTSQVEGLFEAARSCGWWWPFNEVTPADWQRIGHPKATTTTYVIASERTSSLNLDEQLRLHSTTEPALAYPDGAALYCVHGVRVPAEIIEHPERITPTQIMQEDNAEVRRVMMDLYGPARFVAEAGKQVHADTDKHGLPRRLLRLTLPGDEDRLLLIVTNTTPEPDGSHKEYTLFADPAARTCREAVARSMRFPDGKGGWRSLTPAEYDLITLES